MAKLCHRLTSRPVRAREWRAGACSCCLYGVRQPNYERAPPLPYGAIEAPSEDALLSVQAVLGFIKHHRLRAINHIIGDLLAAMRRQTMHEQRARLRLGQQPRI